MHVLGVFSASLQLVTCICCGQEEAACLFSALVPLPPLSTLPHCRAAGVFRDNVWLDGQEFCKGDKPSAQPPLNVNVTLSSGSSAMTVFSQCFEDFIRRF